MIDNSHKRPDGASLQYFTEKVEECYKLTEAGDFEKAGQISQHIISFIKHYNLRAVDFQRIHEYLLHAEYLLSLYRDFIPWGVGKEALNGVPESPFKPVNLARLVSKLVSESKQFEAFEVLRKITSYKWFSRDIQLEAEHQLHTLVHRYQRGFPEFLDDLPQTEDGKIEYREEIFAPYKEDVGTGEDELAVKTYIQRFPVA